MDNVLVDFKTGYQNLSTEDQKTYEKSWDRAPGVFSLMEPMPGAITAFKTLCQKYDTYILSTSPWFNPSAATDKVNWVQKYLENFAYKRLILTHHKNLNQGDYLIDDRDKNGAGEFGGELIKFDPENPNEWERVVHYLMSKE